MGDFIDLDNYDGGEDEFLPKGVRLGMELAQTIIGAILKADDMDNSMNDNSEDLL